MNTLEFLARLFEHITAIAANPLITSDARSAAAVRLAARGARVARHFASSDNALAAADAEIASIVAENRVPNDEEWATWDAREEHSFARIEKAAANS